ncbi:MAG: 2OG-Fe(II) oxygenase [Alphaproteobacteria bacterium]|nr:2OG-Fe(II) oxygenase [Alphaproteobacteria bacterium]
MVIAPSPDAAPSRDLISGLSRHTNALSKAGAHSFILTTNQPSGGLDKSALVMIDPYGDGMRLFRPFRGDSQEEKDRAKASVALLDPNQRVVEVFTVENHRDPLGEAVRRATGVAEIWSRQPVRLDRAAPVMILDKLMSTALREELIANWESDNAEGTVSDGFKNIADPSVKQNREHVVTDPDLQRRVAQEIGPRVVNEIQKVFNYRLPLRFEMLTVLGYDSKRADFFGPHRDNLRSNQRRRFALSLNLNDEYEGGELVFPEYGPHTYGPPSGAGAVFSCELLHRALPVRSGRRLVLTTFLIEPK